jgi:hypothetical protein
MAAELSNASAIAAAVPGQVTSDIEAVLPHSFGVFDPDKLADPESEESKGAWQLMLFEVYLQKFEWWPENKGKCCGTSKKYADYVALDPAKKQEIKDAFIKSQTQDIVDKENQLNDDHDGGALLGDISHWCSDTNKAQGFWNVRGFYDLQCCIKCCILDSKWICGQVDSEILPQMTPLLLILMGVFIGVVQLRLHVKLVYYIYIGIMSFLLLVVYVKWIKHFLQGGYKTYWEDISVEKTNPGAVRYFTIDYFSMMWIVYLWVIADPLGGWKVIWNLFISAAMSLWYVVHCTLSSPDKSVPLAVIYFASAVVWVIVWGPFQWNWLRRAEKGPTYKGRAALGKINEPITMLSKSIIYSFLALAPEMGSWVASEHGLNGGWYYVPAFIAINFICARHIGFAALLIMGIAKMTAEPGRIKFDEYGLCYGTGWNF